MNSFWKPVKPAKKPVKLFSSPILKKYPVRTNKEIRAISLHPSRDSDKDGVMNWYDCKPLNKYKQERIPIIKLPPTRFPQIPPRAREVIPQRVVIQPKPIPTKPRVQVGQPLTAPPPKIASLPYRILEHEREEELEEEEKEAKEEAVEARESMKEEIARLEEEKRIKRQEERLERQIKEDKELEEKEMRRGRKRRKRRKKHLTEF